MSGVYGGVSGVGEIINLDGSSLSVLPRWVGKRLWEFPGMIGDTTSHRMVPPSPVTRCNVHTHVILTLLQARMRHITACVAY